MPRLKKADVGLEIARLVESGDPVFVSPGNDKLDSEDGSVRLPNISLTPEATCPGATELCKRFCYAKQIVKYSPNALVRWTVNEHIVRHDLDGFYHDMWAYLRINPCQYFRLHVGGDFFSQEYLETWYRVAEDYPNTRFLAFTKSFHLDYSCKPDNLMVMWSVFPDTDRETLPPGPCAWTLLEEAGIFYEILIKERPRMDAAIRCVGGCASCGICFHSDVNNVDVIFHAHGQAYKWAMRKYQEEGEIGGCSKESTNDSE